MEKQLVHLPEIKLVGLSLRTNNHNEMNSATAKIGKLFDLFYSKNIADRILNRKNPGILYSVYTDYESDEHGGYTYFLGEEVRDFDASPGLQELIIPTSIYQKFTTPMGQLPTIVIQAWQKIWAMSARELGGHRVYQADFEVYDQRAIDPANANVDIYLGILP